jgi:hypothetical protein
MAQTKTSEWRARELSSSTIRMRDYAEHDTFDITGSADLGPYNECERLIINLSSEANGCILKTLPQLDTVDINPPNELQLNKNLASDLCSLLELVRIAQDATKRSSPAYLASLNAEASSTIPTTSQRTEAAMKLDVAKRLLIGASEIFSALVKLLEKMQTQARTPAQCPADLVVMGHALRRLQQWEGVPNEDSVFACIVQLEREIGPASSLEASSSSAPALPATAASIIEMLGSHSTRVHNAGNVICMQLDDTLKLLNSNG